MVTIGEVLISVSSIIAYLVYNLIIFDKKRNIRLPRSHTSFTGYLMC